jgi:hypothetical protein
LHGFLKLLWRESFEEALVLQQLKYAKLEILPVKDRRWDVGL